VKIQIIKQFSKRTEYKMLRDWISVDERSIDELMTGVCVIPAIILLKLSEIELKSINIWWRQWGNQLIVFPPFHQIDVVTILQLNAGLSIQAIETQKYNSLPVIESIKTNSISKWQLTDGGTVAVDLYEHSGSGRITITTIPLLDYRLLSKGQVSKRLFLELINEMASEETDLIQKIFTLNPNHEYILILASANVLDSAKLSNQLNYYFNTKISQDEATELFQQLIHEKFLESSGSLTDIGKEHIDFKGFRAFVREIKRWRRDDGEWR
jgi:hypothetical protein